MKKIVVILSTFMVILSTSMPKRVLAEHGLPNSPMFGYGVRLDLKGYQINPSIAAASSLNVNWIAIDFDWSYIWPTRESSPILDPLHQAMYLAQQNNISVMISLVNPPEWIISSHGPDVELTIKVVQYLARTYPDVLLAIELFPGANTKQGWGTKPDPSDYFNLVNKVTNALISISSPISIISAGLVPLPQKPAIGDMDDLDFLDALYKYGATSIMPIISMNFLDITGDPMMVPTQSENRCLRHFEEIRQVMIKNDHRVGLIWVTKFAWPASNIQARDELYTKQNEQTLWLSQAFQILKAQLFIGVAFFSQINPPHQDVIVSTASLIRPDLSYHPAFSQLGLLINPPADNSQLSIQTVLVKRIVQDIQFKPTIGNASSGQ